MGELVLAALAPHPPIIIPEIGKGETERAERTVRAMRALAGRLEKAKPDTVIIISPHAPVFRDAVAIMGFPHVGGSFHQFGSRMRLDFSNDLELAHAIAARSRESGLPAVILDEAGARRNRVPRELDHGVLVPAYFLAGDSPRFRLVPMSMGLGTPDELYRFGMSIARAVADVDRRVALIASGDLSHRLTRDAPAGYDPRGQEFDEQVVAALERRDAVAVAALDESLVSAAGECGLRPILMLLGALDSLTVQSEVISYEGPFGVGYAVAAFQPMGGPRSESLLPAIERALGLVAEERRRHESAEVALARAAVEAYVRNGRVVEAPNPLPQGMEGRAGVFCSIHRGRELRGCIGTTSPTRSNIAEEIIRNAIAAATEDPRFDQVRPSELPQLTYKVDVLTPAERISGPEELDPKRYGVIVRRGGRVGLLLPDLEGIDTVEEQIAIARRKAGIGPNEEVELSRFEVVRHE